MGLIHILNFSAQANEGLKWSELRVFISNNSFFKEPTEFNNLTVADNVEKLDHLTGFGLEVDAHFKPWLKIGTRIKGIWNSVYPPNNSWPATAYLSVSHYSGSMLARVPVVEKEVFLFDVFAELGLSNNKIDIQTISSGKVTFTKDQHFFQRAGASIGLGSSSMKIYLEAGQEWNNLNGLNREGTLSTNISSIDLTGPYYAFGLIISGIPSWIKPGGFSIK